MTFDARASAMTSRLPLEEPVELDAYQEFTRLTDKRPAAGVEGLGFVLLGLFGEVGSLLSEIKKKQRDEDAYHAYRDSVVEELGDVLWYLANAAMRAGLALSSIAAKVPAHLIDWDYRGQSGPKSFADLQALHKPFLGPLLTESVERRMIALAGKAGMLLEHYSSGRISLNRDLLASDFTEVFRALLIAADAADASLEIAARRNMDKVVGRYPIERVWGAAFDDGFPPHEQFPRRMEIEFVEMEVDGRLVVTQTMNGAKVGNDLTDNRSESDDYRFHDVFHYAYAAVLGWSPTLRKLLSLKRKSRPSIDENEDGARASIIEEGIATWIFNHAQRNAQFRADDSVDFSVLKVVQEFVKGYEVEARPAWQWRIAIQQGFKGFRGLTQSRGGIVIADLDSHSLELRPHIR